MSTAKYINKKYKLLFHWQVLIYSLFISLAVLIPLFLFFTPNLPIKEIDILTPKNQKTNLKKLVEPRPLAKKIEPAQNGIYFGVYQEDAPFKIKDLNQFEKAAGKKVSILMWYQPWSMEGRNKFNQKTNDALQKRGITPMISWEPWNPGEDPKKLKEPAKQPLYQLKNIIRGDYDGYIRKWAKDLKRFGGPILLRPMHEMNGVWYPWGGPVNSNKPEEFVVAWRHIYKIFDEEGAKNVTWVWSVNHKSVPTNDGHTIDIYYPGDEYVDWTSISGFNWGTSSPWSKWHSFQEVYENTINELSAYNKPIIISEISTVEQGGDKALWIEDAFRDIKNNYPKIKGIVWYNRTDSKQQDWRFETSPQSTKSFRQAVKDSYFLSKPTKALIDFLDKMESTTRKD